MKIKLIHKKRFVLDLLMVGILITGIYFMAQFLFNLKQDVYTIEYGETVSLDAKNYLNLNHKSQKEMNNLLADVHLETDIRNETGKDYPAVGDYHITMTYGNEQKDIQIKVRDTTPPSIDYPESIQLLAGEDPNEGDFQTYFHLRDLSQSTLEFDFLNYNSQKTGYQKIKILASDIYNNQVEQEYLINTVAAPDLKYYDVKKNVQKNSNGLVTKVSLNQVEKKFTLDVQLYCQHDVGARMGCDPAALYQGLRYKGYCMNVSLKEFVLDMPISLDNNPDHGFAGNAWGKGRTSILETIYPTPMVDWAKKYGKVSNFSGHSVADIIAELKKGNTLMIYATHNFEEPEWRDWFFGKMYNNIHCLTVSGYDPIKHRIRVSDPGAKRASYWVDLDLFALRYNYKKFAILIE